MVANQSLGARLGLTRHESLLWRKAQRLAKECPSSGAVSLEDWLMDVALARGADVVVRSMRKSDEFVPPALDAFNNEDLTIAMCLSQAEDRPQMLRLAAQLISADKVNPDRLAFYARRERAMPIVAELARQALRVEPEHKGWRALLDRLGPQKPLCNSLLHWTRLAEPVMRRRGPNVERWVLRR